MGLVRSQRREMKHSFRTHQAPRAGQRECHSPRRHRLHGLVAQYRFQCYLAGAHLPRPRNCLCRYRRDCAGRTKSHLTWSVDFIEHLKSSSVYLTTMLSIFGQ